MKEAACAEPLRRANVVRASSPALPGLTASRSPLLSGLSSIPPDPERLPEHRRVALFSGAYDHIADGATLTLNRLVAYLENRGANVRVFAPTTDTPALDHAGTLIPVTSIAAPGRPDYRMSIGLTPTVRRQVREFQPNLFHIASPDFLGRAALVAGRRKRIPVAGSYHTNFSSYLKYYGFGWGESIVESYLRWFYSLCDHVYVPTASMLEVLKESRVSAPLYIWPRGVDLDLYNPSRRSADFRAGLGFSEDDVVVTFVSRLVWEKGLGVFTQAMKRLAERGVRVKTLMVGDGPVREHVESELPSAVFTGHLSGVDLATAYASSDIFLFPSDTETFGNVTLEAMASGVPTVCANAPGSASLVQNGATGYLCPPGDVSAFTGAVEEIALDKDLQMRMAADARRLATTFTWDKVMDSIWQYYGLLLYGTPSGGASLTPANGSPSELAGESTLAPTP
jgi:glycosyltransferase involved in cell wall biosynthesis